MANFFSANYWKALYFKAMGGQESATDPNAMSGTFVGTSSWTGTADQPVGAISGTFTGVSSWTGTLDEVEEETALRGRPIRRRGRSYEPPHSEFWDKPLAARVSPEDAPPPGVAAPTKPERKKRDWLGALLRSTVNDDEIARIKAASIENQKTQAQLDAIAAQIKAAEEEEERRKLLLLLSY